MAQKKSRKRKSSKKKSRKVSTAYETVPPEIRPLISQRHILASENLQVYDDLFKSLAAVLKPKDVLQWLRLKELHDLMWDKQRMSRIKPAIIDAAQAGVLLKILQSLPQDVKMRWLESSPVMEHYMSAWFQSAETRRELERLLAMFNYSKDAIDGMAFVERVSEIETLEKLQAANEMRQQMLYRQLEEDTTIDLLPNKANDNEERPAQLTHHQDEHEEAGDREQAQSERDVEALETAGVGDADSTDHEEDPSDREEANQDADGHEEPDDVDAVEEAATDEGADEPDEEAA